MQIQSTATDLNVQTLDILGAEIAEFNPARDRNNVTAGVVRNLLAACVPPGAVP